ncbi:dehydrogenase with different specificitie [Aspergillus insuetus]
MAFHQDFKDKVAMVTGAGTGIGAETVLLLAERGAKVTIVGRREAPLRKIEQTVIQAGREALVAVADVSDMSQVDRVIEDTLNHFGPLHYAVNNAGISGDNFDLPDLPKDVWDQTIAINLSSIFYCMKAQIRAIDQAGGGSIVNVSSVFADRGLIHCGPYSAAKHTIRGLTRATAIDWAPRKIRINELQAGMIETPMTATNPVESGLVAATIPAKRLGRPRECVAAIAFLLSDDASVITGAHLAVDGDFLA